MTEPAAQKKARLIRLLHVAKSQLMMADDVYRALLANVTRGKTSSKALSVTELEQVLVRMKALGFVVAGKAKPMPGRQDLPVRDHGKQVAMIRGLWLELHRLGAVRSPTEAALAKFCKRMTGVDYHGWLGTDKASDVIEHLKQWQQRVERGQHG